MKKDRLAAAAPWFLGALAAFVAGILVIAALPQGPADEPVVAVAAPAVAPAPAPASEPAPEPEPAAPMPPRFDTFRVEPDGMIVVAGRARAGQDVAIMLGDAQIEMVTADSSGAFAALAMAGPSDQPRRLSLLADPAGARIASRTSYLVAPIAAPVAVAAAAPELPQLAEAAVEPAETAQDTAPALAVQDPVAVAPVAEPVVIAADADGLRVVQGAADAAPASVTLDAITYAPDGAVQLAGRAPNAAAVQVYLDNAAIAMALTDPDGGWRLDLRDVAAGVYTLRVDALDLSGAVIARAQTPFQRETVADLAAAIDQVGPQAADAPLRRVVQPGSTLWAIAEETLGEGIFYVAVFEANRDLIRDPDLIYPGQVFVIPQAGQ